MQTRTALKSMESKKGLYDNTGDVQVEFLIGHNDQKITLEQTLILRSSNGKWAADMPMKDFPKQNSADDAANKLADWFEKMAVSIRAGQYNQVDLNKI